MITASSLQVPGGWRAARVQADNDPIYPALRMNMGADYATLLDPTTGLTKTVFEGLSQPCFINGAGVHGRDQAAPFVARDVVHFYFIDGEGPGTASICSKRKPSAGGPILPEGYTHFCPAFVLPMVGSATLLPTLPQGGVYAISGAQQQGSLPEQSRYHWDG